MPIQRIQLILWAHPSLLYTLRPTAVTQVNSYIPLHIVIVTESIITKFVSGLQMRIELDCLIVS